MKRRLAVLAAIAAVLVCTAGWSFAQDTIGSVKTSQGAAFVDRDGVSLPAHQGLTVRASDTLRTGSDGSLGVLFRDDSVLSIGPDSVFQIEKFQFAPAQQQFGFVGRIVRGTAAYLSGLMGKLSPDSVRFETPEATIGIRGTRFAIQVQ